MNNPNARLEQLLRQWGAREAVGQSAAPAMPEVPQIASVETPSYAIQPQPPSVDSGEPAAQVEAATTDYQTPSLETVEVEPLELELHESERHIVDPNAIEPPPDEPDEPVRPADQPQQAPAAEAVDEPTASVEQPEPAAVPAAMENIPIEELELFAVAAAERAAVEAAAAEPQPVEPVEQPQTEIEPVEQQQAQSQEQEELSLESQVVELQAEDMEPRAEMPAESQHEEPLAETPSVGATPAGEPGAIISSASIDGFASDEVSQHVAESQEIISTQAGKSLDESDELAAPADEIEPISTAPLENETADIPAQPQAEPAPISLDIPSQPEDAFQAEEETQTELEPEPEQPEAAAVADIEPVRFELSDAAGRKVEAEPKPEPAQPTPADMEALAAEKTVLWTGQDEVGETSVRQPQKSRDTSAAPAGVKQRSAARLAAKISGLMVLAAIMLFVGAVFLSGLAGQSGFVADIRKMLAIGEPEIKKEETAKDAAAALSAADKEIQKLSFKLDANRETLKKTLADLHDAQETITKLLQKDQQAADVQARGPSAGQASDADMEKLKAELDKVRSDYNFLNARTQAQEKKLQEVLKEKAALTQEVKLLDQMRKDRREVDDRLLAAMDDIQKKNARINELEPAINKAQSELGATQAEFLRTTRALQKLYMSASAPGQSGIAAAQAATRHNKLLARCKELANTPQEASTRLLRDRVDAVLTKLELVPAGDWPAGQKFTKMVDDTGIIPLIDEILKGQREAPEINAWLLEVRIVLVSAGCAG